MWRDYFGKKAKIYGIDINPDCKKFEEEGVEIFIGSQEDRNFLQKVKRSIPKIDILIDDGGHTMKQQIVTFEELYSHVKEDGIYFIEDLHTSYWLSYGGGHKRSGTFIEYSKNFIDYINAWHSHQNSLRTSEFTKSAFGLHYYDSILVIENKIRNVPFYSTTGNPSIENTYKKPTTLLNRIGDFLFLSVNSVLAKLRIRSIFNKPSNP